MEEGIVCVALKRSDTRLNLNEGRGSVTHSRHECSLLLDDVSNLNSANDELFAAMGHFEYFNGRHNDVAIVYLETTSDGQLFARFDALGFVGRLSRIVNGVGVPVRLWRSRSSQTVTGDTAGKHMLVGQRRWSVCRNGTVLTVVTESYEQPRGFCNLVGFLLCGRGMQLDIWTKYLLNIATWMHRTHRCVHISIPTIDEASPPPNPWQPVEPYPGANAS